MNVTTGQSMAKWWVRPTAHPRAMRVGVACVYGWFLVHAALVWSGREWIWGEQSVLMRYGAPGGVLENSAYALMYNLSLFPLVWWTHLLAAAAGMFDKHWSWLPRMVAWFTGWLLYYAGYAALNSGLLLMLLLAFYLIPYCSTTSRPERMVLNNAGRSAVQLQIAMVYALSCFWKALGTQWISGTALYYTFNISHYSPVGWAEEGVQQTLLLALMTWVSLAYQALFPLLIWWKQARAWLVPVGIVFHLSVGYATHLWDFAFAMLAAYTLFSTDRGR